MSHYLDMKVLFQISCVKNAVGPTLTGYTLQTVLTDVHSSAPGTPDANVPSFSLENNNVVPELFPSVCRESISSPAVLENEGTV